MKVGIGLPNAVRGVDRAGIVEWYLAGFEAAGTDDVICFPVSADVGQVDRLAEVAFG